MSRDGREKLLEDLSALDRREKEVSELMADAREGDPDIHVNVPFRDARSELMYTIPVKRKELELALAEAELIEDSEEYLNSDFSVVIPGSRVELEIDGEPQEYLIVGSPESSVDSGKISYESPLAILFLGRREEDVFNAELPSGKVISIRILKISRGLI